MPGIDANTVLCLHCDGTDGSPTFTDSATVPHTMTAGGNAQIDTAQSKFGGASALFDGTGDYISAADSADWNFGSGDFTIDLWVMFNGTPSGQQGLVCQYAPGSNQRAFRLELNKFVAGFWFAVSSDGANESGLNLSWSPVGSTWYHVAVVRSGTTLTGYVNGTSLGSVTNSVNIFDSPALLTVGTSVSDGTGALNGWIDEVRISKGIARWTANFTPPTAPYDTSTGATYNLTPSGGIVLGGSQVSSRALDLTRTGGIVLGGTAASDCAVALLQTGGIVLGGTAAYTRAVSYTPAAAGIVLGGSCTSSVFRGYSDTPSGGIVLGGAPGLVGSASLAPSGGLALGGSVVTVLTLPGPVYTVTPSGGLALGGSVVQDIARALSTTGGIRLNGTCSSSISLIITYTSTPSGGIIFGGVSGTAGEAVALPPVVDRIDGGWTDQVGGTDLYAAVDELAVNDADYIKSASSPITADICEIAFTPAIDPFSSTGHALSYRYGSEAEGWTTVVRVLSAAQADAITQYGHLSVKFEAKV